MAPLRAQGKSKSAFRALQRARCAALLSDKGQPVSEDFTGMGVLEIPRG